MTARVERSDIFSRSSYARKHGAEQFYVGRLYVAYEFNGRTYRSAIVLSNSSTDRGTIERRLAAIATGEAREVRVDPRSPHEMKSVDAWPLVLPRVFVFAGLVMSGIAILIFRSAPKKRFEPQRHGVHRGNSAEA